MSLSLQVNPKGLSDDNKGLSGKSISSEIKYSESRENIKRNSVFDENASCKSAACEDGLGKDHRSKNDACKNNPNKDNLGKNDARKSDTGKDDISKGDLGKSGTRQDNINEDNLSKSNAHQDNSNKTTFQKMVAKIIAACKSINIACLVIVSFVIALISSASIECSSAGILTWEGALPLISEPVPSGAGWKILTLENLLSVSFVLRTVVLTALFIILFAAALLVLRKLNSLQVSTKIQRIAAKPSSTYLVAIVLAVCWLPCLLLMFPGNLSNDTTGQLAMFYSMMDGGTYALSDHHPFFDTLVFGSIVYFVGHLTGSIHIGIFVCILLQLCITAVVFAYAFRMAYTRWNVSLLLCLILLLFVALFPVIPIAVASLSKDTFFSWVFLLWFVMLCDLLLTKFERLNSKAFVAAFIAVGILAVLTKKLGIFVIAPTLLLVVLLASTQRKNKIALCVPLLCVVLVMGLVMPRALSLAGVDSGLAKERYSLLYQQTALTYIEHGSEMTAEELASLEEIFGSSEQLGSSYNPAIADPVKDLVNNDLLRDYLHLYIQQGLEYPDTYITALVLHISYIFSDAPIAGLFNSSWHTWNNDYLSENTFEKSSFNTEMSEEISSAYADVSGAPGISLIFSQGLYAVFIPALLLIATFSCRKGSKRNSICLAIPMVVSLAGLVVSPTLASNAETMRYLLPFVYCAPIVLAVVAVLTPKQIPSENKS